MNKLEIKKAATDYGYEYLGLFIDDESLDIYLSKLTNKEMITGLLPAWFMELDSIGEQEYINGCLTIESKNGLVVPILLCPDDMDFWCTVIVAKVRYTDENVLWDKVGIIKMENWDTDCWVKSGIRNFEKWTEEEWNLYGSYFDLFNLNDWRWDDWISTNWREEEKKRIINYTHQYFNNDENIEWFENVPKLIFGKEIYKNEIGKSIDL